MMDIQFGVPNRMAVILFICLTIIHITSAADWGLHTIRAEDWGYSGPDGPETWKERYPECGGRRQSPININFNATKLVTSNQAPIKWKHYNKEPAETRLYNNGHSIQVIATSFSGQEPYLEIDSKIFDLVQTHFHWGKTNKNGSEHTFNNNRYPLEMHAVHQRVVNGKIADPPELVVITILFEISTSKNPGLERFVHFIPEVKNAGENITIPPFPADTLIPPFDSSFFRYEGSLTTPRCSEIVTFYIRKELSNVSNSQLELLRVALNEEGEEIAGNFRPIQPLNGRTVNYVKRANIFHSLEKLPLRSL